MCQLRTDTVNITTCLRPGAMSTLTCRREVQPIFAAWCMLCISAAYAQLTYKVARLSLRNVVACVWTGYRISYKWVLVTIYIYANFPRDQTARCHWMTPCWRFVATRVSAPIGAYYSVQQRKIDALIETISISAFLTLLYAPYRSECECSRCLTCVRLERVRYALIGADRRAVWMLLYGIWRWLDRTQHQLCCTQTGTKKARPGNKDN